MGNSFNALVKFSEGKWVTASPQGELKTVSFLGRIWRKIRGISNDEMGNVAEAIKKAVDEKKIKLCGITQSNLQNRLKSIQLKVSSEDTREKINSVIRVLKDQEGIRAPEEMPSQESLPKAVLESTSDIDFDDDEFLDISDVPNEAIEPTASSDSNKTPIRTFESHELRNAARAFSSWRLMSSGPSMVMSELLEKEYPGKCQVGKSGFFRPSSTVDTLLKEIPKGEKSEGFYFMPLVLKGARIWNRDHNVCIMIDWKNKQILYFDPQGRPLENETRCIIGEEISVNNLVKKLREKLRVTHNQEFEVASSTTVHQGKIFKIFPDTWNCGRYVQIMMDKVARSEGKSMTDVCNDPIDWKTEHGKLLSRIEKTTPLSE